MRGRRRVKVPHCLTKMRYITRIEPIASVPVEQLVVTIGPTVQRYLTGEIGSR